MNRKLRKYVFPFLVGSLIGLVGTENHIGLLKLMFSAGLAGVILGVANGMIDNMEDNNNDNSGL